MNNLTQENRLTIFYILIAFTFSVAMRFIWVYQFNGYAPFYFNGQFMINTNDGYYWAEGARDILSGATNVNSTSPITSAVSTVTALFKTILPFSFESVIFYMPVFLSSLIVIPIILISKRLKNLEMGLISALLASIAWSYYNRTMIGYYDSDMLNIVLPMFLLWSIIWSIDTNKNVYLAITALDILAYRLWYPQSYSLEFSFFGLMLFYTLVFDRKNVFNYKLLSIMLLAMLGVDIYTKLALVVTIYLVFTQEKFDKYIYYILGLSSIIFFTTGGIDPILGQLKGYFFTNSITADNSGLNLHFFSVVQTVREAGHIPFETFANRISGHTVTFIMSLLGYLYLSYKHKIMLFALPLVGLGFLASVGGLRFTVYAVPIMAFGIAFLITEISSRMPTKPLKYILMVLFTLAVLYPNYKHIEAYKVPTVFNSTEVKVLNKLKNIASREDYVVTWWDYGFPIRYYSDVKTLVDGAQHGGSANFPVSFILTHPEEEAAQMARLDVEYTEKGFESNQTASPIEQMTLDYGFKNTNDFLKSLKTDIKLPKKTRDIYLYLPYKMLSIYPTIELFSNMNLMTGKKNRAPFFFMSKNFKESTTKIDLGSGVYLNKSNATLVVGKNIIALKRFVKTTYDNKMKLHVDEKLLNTSSNINLIYMSNYHTFLVLDDKVYNSLYIQLMVLQKYNKKLFEAVVLNPNVKIYKLKI